MIDGVTRQGGQPGLPDRVTLSAGVEFCHLNVSRWVDRPGPSRIRGTSNSRKMQCVGGFAFLLKLKIERHCTEGCSRSNK